MWGFLGKVILCKLRGSPQLRIQIMSVNSTDVVQVAALARLKIDDHDLEDVTQRFSRILDLVAELQQVNTDGVEPMSNPHDQIQRLRADVVSEEDQREQLQEPAPAVAEGYFLVPRVID